MSMQGDATAVERKQQSDKQFQVDATQLCRVCGELRDDLVPVFGKSGVQMDLINKIHTHLPIEVSVQDVLPIACCNQCIEKLDACQELVNQCLEADWKLRSLLLCKKHIYRIEYQFGNKDEHDNLGKEASLRFSNLARNIASNDEDSMQPRTSDKKRQAPPPNQALPFQGDTSKDIHILYSSHLPQKEKEEWPKSGSKKRKSVESTLPNKERTDHSLAVNHNIANQKKNKQKCKVVLVTLKNSAGLSKAVQIEKALEIVKTKQEAGNMPAAKGPVPKRLQKKLQGLKTYGLLKPNKCIRLPMEPKDYEEDEMHDILTSSHIKDKFICPSCDKIFLTINALNHHVASLHTDLLFCYCSKFFQTQALLDKHLKLHISEAIDSEPKHCHVMPEDKNEAAHFPVMTKVRSELAHVPVMPEVRSEPTHSRAVPVESELAHAPVMTKVRSEPAHSPAVPVESEPAHSHEVPDGGSKLVYSPAMPKVGSEPTYFPAMLEVKSEPVSFSSMPGVPVAKIKSEPLESSPTNKCELSTFNLVPQTSTLTPRVRVKKLGGMGMHSYMKENSKEKGKSDTKSVDIRLNPFVKEIISHNQGKGDIPLMETRHIPLIKERIAHDQGKRTTTSASVGPGSSNRTKIYDGRIIPISNVNNKMSMEVNDIDLTENNDGVCDMGSSLESPVAFSSVRENAHLLDAIIASVPKVQFQMWRCQMCGLVFPAEECWLNNCDGIHYRCHFCKTVLGSTAELRQHELQHLKSIALHKKK